MSDHIIFACKVFVLSTLISCGLFVASAILGLCVYIALDPLMPADDLAAFMLAWLPSVVLGLPGVIAAARLTLLRRRHKLQLAIYAVTGLLGTLGFAGFWVGAMGI